VSARLWDRFCQLAAEPFPGAEGFGRQECCVKATASVMDALDREEFRPGAGSIAVGHPLTRGPEAFMKLMLTSGGVTNASIHSALVRLLGKPVTESRALCVPTAQWGHPVCNPTSVQGFTAAGSRWRHSSGLGWA